MKNKEKFKLIKKSSILNSPSFFLFNIRIDSEAFLLICFQIACLKFSLWYVTQTIISIYPSPSNMASQTLENDSRIRRQNIQILEIKGIIKKSSVHNLP